MSEAAEFWQRAQTRIGFDGVYRPEPWLHASQWRAVAYTNDGRNGVRHMDDHQFRVEEEAQARCDELNATRGAVSPPKQTPKTQERLI